MGEVEELIAVGVAVVVYEWSVGENKASRVGGK